MAGVGDEVGSHALDAPSRREITKKQQDRRAGARVLRIGVESRHLNLEPALRWDTLGEVGPQRSSRPGHFVQSFEHVRAA